MVSLGRVCVVPMLQTFLDLDSSVFQRVCGRGKQNLAIPQRVHIYKGIGRDWAARGDVELLAGKKMESSRKFFGEKTREFLGDRCLGLASLVRRQPADYLVLGETLSCFYIRLKLFEDGLTD